MTAPPPLARAARDAAARIEAVFEEVPRRLGEALDGLGAQVAALRGVAALVDAGGRARLLAEAGGLAALARESGEAAERLACARDRLDADLLAMAGLVEAMARDARAAGAVVLSAIVVGRAQGGRGAGFERHAADLRRELLALDGSLAEVAGTIARAEALRRALGDGVEAVREAALALSASGDGLARRLGSLGAAGALGLRAEALARRLGALEAPLGAALMRLQSGDAVRQRLEHAAAILEAAGLDDAAVAHLGRAQLAAALDGLRADVGALPAMLDRLGRQAAPVEAELAALAADEGLGADLAGAGALAAALTAAAEGVAARLGALDAPRAELGAVCEGLARMAGRIGPLEERMQRLGLNALLAAARLGEDGRAMGEVARQLREVTGALGSGAARLAALARGQALRAAEMGGGARPAPPGTPALAGIGAGLARLRELAAPGRPRLAAVAGEGGARLAAFGAALPPRPALPAAAPEADARARARLAELRRLYTMQAERTVHDALFGEAAMAG